MLARPEPVERRTDKLAQRRQMVATLLHHDGGKSERPEGILGPPVAVDGHLQRAVGIKDRGIHFEGNHEGGCAERRGGTSGALDGRQPDLVPGPWSERQVEVGPESGIAPGLFRETDMTDPCHTVARWSISPGECS